LYEISVSISRFIYRKQLQLSQVEGSAT
ncbi:twin-arginine translocase subunit TatC, partial [Clostridium perfringens]